jgi:predicted aspartyl protease
MALTFPITSDGLVVDVLVNLEVGVLLPLWAQGRKPQPITGRALIDTGSDISAVSSAILRQLGVPIFQTVNTQGIGGSVAVNLHYVGLHLYDSRVTSLPWIFHPTLLVMELPAGVPFDALIGMDVLHGCKLWVDGPAGQFTLDT